MTTCLHACIWADTTYTLTSSHHCTRSVKNPTCMAHGLARASGDWHIQQGLAPRPNQMQA
jgi:hypothetical protein